MKNITHQHDSVLSEIESRLQLVITMAMFFPTLIYAFFKFAGEAEQQTNETVLAFSTSVATYLISYILFQLFKRKFKSVLFLKWLNSLLLIGIATFVPIILFLTVSKAITLTFVSGLYFLGSLFAVALAPVVVLILIASYKLWDIKILARDISIRAWTHSAKNWFKG